VKGLSPPEGYTWHNTDVLVVDAALTVMTDGAALASKLEI
jgi:hypothetical protein